MCRVACPIQQPHPNARVATRVVVNRQGFTHSGSVSLCLLFSSAFGTPFPPVRDFRLSCSAAPALSAEAGAGAHGLPILVATSGGQFCKEGRWHPVRASMSGTGAKRRARCLRENVRVRSAPFVVATIFNMRHDPHSLLCKEIGPAPCCWKGKQKTHARSRSVSPASGPTPLRMMSCVGFGPRYFNPLSGER